MKQTNRTHYALQRGFTLIEVMVVVVILGLLAALIVPNVFGQGEKAKVSTTQTNLKSISGALDLFKLDNNRYPSTQEGLNALVNKPANVKNWTEGGYLKGSNLKDAWGNELQYYSPGANGLPYELFSYGSDGKEGGEGTDADIVLER